jgi:hypothetical protein
MLSIERKAILTDQHGAVLLVVLNLMEVTRTNLVDTLPAKGSAEVIFLDRKNKHGCRLDVY